MVCLRPWKAVTCHAHFLLGAHLHCRMHFTAFASPVLPLRWWCLHVLPLGTGFIRCALLPLQCISMHVCTCMGVCVHVCIFVYTCVYAYVYVRVCLCMHVPMCVCIYMPTYVHVYGCACVYICVYMYVFVRVCAHVCMHVPTCVCLDVHIREYMYVHVCVCMCICLCMCVYVYICTCVYAYKYVGRHISLCVSCVCTFAAGILGGAFAPCPPRCG